MSERDVERVGLFLSSLSAASGAQPIIRLWGPLKSVEINFRGWAAPLFTHLKIFLYQGLVTSGDGDFTTSKAKNLQAVLT